MTERVHPDGGTKDHKQFTPVIIPDLRKFLPTHSPIDAQSSKETEDQHLFSLFVSGQGHFAKIDYKSLAGAIPYPSKEFIVDPVGTNHPGMKEIVIGTAVARSEVPWPLNYVTGHLRDIVNELVTPIGVTRFRDHGESVCGIALETKPNHTKIEVFAQPLLPLPEAKRDELHMEYQIKRGALHPDRAIQRIKEFYVRYQPITPEDYESIDAEEIDERFKDLETRFDCTLLYPEVAKMSPMNAHTDNYHQELETMYPERLNGLNEGYVTLDGPNSFYLVELPPSLHNNPDAIEQDGKFFLPNLRSLYFVHQLDQAGFDVKLVEDHEGSEYPKDPNRDSFAIMIRPKKQPVVSD